MTAARKPKGPRGFLWKFRPEPPKGWRRVWRGRSRPGDWIRINMSWDDGGGTLWAPARVGLKCGHRFKVSRPAARGRDGKGRGK